LIAPFNLEFFILSLPHQILDDDGKPAGMCYDYFLRVILNFCSIVSLFVSVRVCVLASVVTYVCFLSFIAQQLQVAANAPDVIFLRARGPGRPVPSCASPPTRNRSVGAPDEDPEVTFLMARGPAVENSQQQVCATITFSV
jgi:hypothetical protein